MVQQRCRLSYVIADKDVEVLEDRTLMGHELVSHVLAKGSVFKTGLPRQAVLEPFREYCATTFRPERGVFPRIPVAFLRMLRGFQRATSERR